MTIEFKIHEQDFLAYQLFTAYKSNRINKKKRNGWILLTIGSMAIAFHFYLNEHTAMSIYFVIVAIACGLFYPKYFKWRYKKYYKTFIKENYSNRFGQLAMLELNHDWILSKDKTGEGKIILSEVERIDETYDHFFLKISTGISLLIPKKELTDIDGLRAKFKDLGLSVYDELKWKWE